MKRVLTALAVGVAALAAWSLMQAERPVAEPVREPVSARLLDARLVVRHQGIRYAEITAQRVEVSADRRATTFTGRPRIVLYAGDRRVLVATGARMVYDRPTQAVRAEGGLRLTTPEGASLAARTAIWDPQSQVIELAGDVDVTFPYRLTR
ncbi:MAG: hypothetical protein QN178_17020 [Armatimonadota bacterium]|nr:hypothetical protein [Armatimonadota bacterium]